MPGLGHGELGTSPGYLSPATTKRTEQWAGEMAPCTHGMRTQVWTPVPKWKAGCSAGKMAQQAKAAPSRLP